MLESPTCTFLDCSKARRYTGGLCQAHYRQQLKGHVLAPLINRGRSGPRVGFEVRFWEKVRRGGPDECWTWQSTLTTKGYGYFVIDNKIWRRAHRLSYELMVGPIPDGLFVLHRCDNPPCVNPDHLFLGTNTDNMRDRSAKGRARNGATKRLTPEE